MKGDAKLLQILNELLGWELTAINQYFVQASMCANWGYERLAAKIRKESLNEMKHAEELIERILHLEGTPNILGLQKVRIGEKVREQLRLDLQVELEAVTRLNKAIALAVEVGDNCTREMLDGILGDEDDHVSWIESQLELIKQVGEENYLAQQIHEKAD
jgi:bacterioferritin